MQCFNRSRERECLRFNRRELVAHHSGEDLWDGGAAAVQIEPRGKKVESNFRLCEQKLAG